jgi:hypothetical protein
LEERFPKAIPYVYQVAALMGFGHLLISKMFLTVFDVDLRFWYNFFYLAVGLANIVAVNIYLAVSKKSWMLAKVWSASVTFPTLFVSIFFVYHYGYLQAASVPLLTVDLILILSVAILGIAVAVLLSPKLLNELRRR